MKLLVSIVAAALLAIQTPGVEEVRDRLDAYLVAYEPQLSSVVATEEMTQRTESGNRDSRRPHSVDNRRLRSEVAFVSLPNDAGWLGLRRVMTVNGKSVKDQGKSLARLIPEGSANDFNKARALLAASAIHNLGAPRTINLPNLPLELLHRRNRHRFSVRLDGREKIRGASVARLAFEETSLPTIIQQGAGGDMRSVVMAWVEASTGRLLRAEVRSRDVRIGVPPFEAIVWVDFAESPALGMLVPAEMKETFYVSRVGDGQGTAKYSDYRRFQTSARIVPQ